MILIDTSVMVDVFRGPGTENAERLVMFLGTEDMAFTRFNELELLMGAQDKRDWDRLCAFLDRRVIIDPEPEMWRQAARLYFDLRRGGKTIRSIADCGIALIAVKKGLLLVHNDRDFERIAEVIPLQHRRLKLRQGSST